MSQTQALTDALAKGEVKLPEFPEAVQKAITNGDIGLDIGEVKATADGKTARKNYVKTIPQGDGAMNGALALVEGSKKKLFGLFWYGFDLGVRNTLRPSLVAELEGPEKIIARASRDLVAAGCYDTEALAREAVCERRKKKGLPV